MLSDRFITDGDKEWFDVELTNTLEKELGEEAAEIIKEPKYFVDFMRDAPEPTGEEVSLRLFVDFIQQMFFLK